MTAKTRKITKVLCLVLSVILVFVGAVFAFLKIGEIKLRESLSFKDEGLSSEEAYGDEAEVFYKGQGYVYNQNLINILCIGVDKTNINVKRDRQADALYLLSLDTENDKLNVVAISRNTLADIDIYDMNDEFLSTEKAQICVSYAYGKDDKHSAQLTSKAVSRLLYDIPVNAYYTIFMDSVAQLVDAVGGVKVVIPEDMTKASKDWYKGKTVTLNSSNALKFVQYREETNTPRFERQKLFISSFFKSAKSAITKDISLPIDMYKKLSKSTVTDIKASSVSYLASELIKAEMKLYNISGEVGFDGKYETFTADEKKLYETVLNLFYIKTN